MKVNADLSKPAAVHGADLPWIPSPSLGVLRRMLDRDGEEVARATSIVQFAPGSEFPFHIHHGGEEMLILEGVFSDAITGACGAGTYLRHPIGSSHTPWSKPGCTLLVKLRQMTDATETCSTVIDTNCWQRNQPGTSGKVEEAWVLPLYQNDITGERVRMEWWPEGHSRTLHPGADGGLELFVVEGEVMVNSDHYRGWGWVRLPAAGTAAKPVILTNAGNGGCRLWIKTGHLRQ